MADGNILTRVDPILKRDFEWACNEADQTGSQVLRQHMRNFIKEVFNQKVRSITLDGSNPDSQANIKYDPADPEEVLLVKGTIFVRKEFLSLHPEVPLYGYDKREQMKRDAREKVNDKKLPVSERTEAALQIMKAHYVRSVENIVVTDSPSSFTDHPGFAEFASHYIKSSPPDQDFGQDVAEELTARYPLEGPSCISPGSSYWPE